MTETNLPWLRWDTNEIIKYQVEFLLENAREDGETLTEDAAWENASSDSDLFTFEWECLTDNLTGWMEEMNKGSWWHCEVSGFGWRRQGGFKNFWAETGRELLREILLDTDCTFTITYDAANKELRLSNAHHDAPTSGEIYVIREMKEEDED